ncbi:DUF4349 domain-containing protein [Fodinicola feengrottensis]|nr:DUF4349 domain-containing protein [Fodinicola feengrottensis]
MISLTRRRWLAAAVLTILVTGPALAGCTSSTGSGFSAPVRNGGVPDGVPAVPGTSGPGAAAGGSVPKLPPLQPKSVVYNGDMTVSTSTVDKVADQATALATGAGGQVGSDQRSGQGATATATLVLRVPPPPALSTVNALSKLGTETNRTIGTQDVTGQVVDLDSRIATAQASVNRTRALFARAQQISDIVTLEQQLSDRETALETLLGQKKTLDDQINLSTITVRVVATSAPAKKSGHAHRFRRRPRGGVERFGQYGHGLAHRVRRPAPFPRRHWHPGRRTLVPLAPPAYSPPSRPRRRLLGPRSRPHIAAHRHGFAHLNRSDRPGGTRQALTSR